MVGRTLADPLLRPVHEELERRGALPVHPPGRRGSRQPADHRARHDLDGRSAGRPAAAAAAFGADRLVLGTDFPYEDGEVFLRAVDCIADAGLTPEETAMILDTNAAGPLGRADAP
ncbi:amidohydrolase family protein [Streptomyces katrae]|uniref:amidohydrolase family protein n=1 Tax=Streptomyces katrae TaxID=68223 RepID=UPI0004C0FC84|nr:amidohydrolase family protein [Streptomyces katrae]